MPVRLPARFPYRSAWPASVPRPPVERRTGVDYETAWSRRYGVRLVRALALDGLTRPAVRALASPSVDGLDRLEGLRAPVIFAANHASHLDTPLLLTSLPARFRHRAVVAAAADYFFDKRWKGHLWSFAIGAVPMERQRVSRRSADLAADLLEQGWNVVIFPEGGRTPDGWAQPFRGGAAYLSLRVGAPVVPVHLEGTRRVLRRGRQRLSPGPTRVTFGEPMAAEDGEDARRFAARIEDAVAVLADEVATDWWAARRRAAAGATPELRGPDAAPWRRAWALGDERHVRPRPSWPEL